MSVRSPILVRAAAALILLAAGEAGASSVSLERHGAWNVVSVPSLSGDGAAADASAGLVQENAAGELRANWDQGGSISMSVTIESCYADDEIFFKSYSVPAARWRALSSREVANRLESDFGNWLAQARVACRETVQLKLFKMGSLRAAAKDFAARVRYLGD